MRKILALLFLLSASAFAQSNRFPPINLYTGDPTGNGCSGNLIQQSTTTGLLYTCQGGTMKAGGSTGGGSVSGQTPAAIPLATGATALTKSSPLSVDDVNTPTLVTSTVNFNAPAVNGIYDLKAKFGASGSQQTMTCTATGGSSVLTGCTGGDFKVGQWVFLPAMGLAATATTPVAPTLTCVSHSGGSCTGTTVYGYKIVAAQGNPNATLTAAGPAQTITQATHIMQQIGNSGSPDVGTTISWSAVANASLYYIYKSFNGGAYNYYTHTIGGTTITDYGGMGSAGLFTCVDEGVPCTAPSTITPNDVYAQITAINGGTVTIAAPASLLKYFAVGGLGSTTMPTQPVQSGTVIVQHDDTPAFHNARTFLAALSNGGQVELHIPAGSYNTHSVSPYGGLTMMYFNGLNNVTIQGDGAASKIYQANDRGGGGSTGFFGACGFGSVSPTGGCVSYGPLRAGGGPSYSLVDPVNAGQNRVTLTTPSDASHFPAGQYVTIGGTGVGYPNDTYGELNLVTASDATTGVVKLAYPTNKVYSVTLPTLYSTGCAGCAAAPAMGPVTPNPTATHIKLRNFWFRGDVRFISINTMDDFEESGLTVLSNGTEGQGLVRHRFFDHNNISEDGFFNSQSLLANAAVGSADYVVTNNTYTTIHGANTGQPCSEGSVNELFSNNIYSLSGNYQNPAGGGAFMGMGWGCWGLVFTGNNVTIKSDAMGYVIGSADGGGSAIYTGNQFNLDSISPSGSAFGCVQSQGLSGAFSKVFHNNWNITTPGQSCYKVSGSAATLPPVDSVAIAGSAGLAIYPYYGSQTVFTYTLTANVTSISIGSTRIPGYMFMIDFLQDGTGGHWLPTNCSAVGWGVAIDCINGTPIQLNLTANAHTYVWFYDDGTTVHELWTSEPSMATYATITAANATGNITLYPYYPLNAKMLLVPVVGNITQVALTGGRHAANTRFGIAFTQDATGSRTLPADCLEAHWAVGASGIDCPNGAPKLNPAANSTTYLWFYDDGTTVHFLTSNYNTVLADPGSNGVLKRTAINTTAAAVAADVAALWASGACGSNFMKGDGTCSSAGTGTVTGVTGTSPIASSGGTAPAISIATCAAGTLGACSPDGTTITASGGVLTAVSGAGTVTSSGTIAANHPSCFSTSTNIVDCTQLASPNFVPIRVAKADSTGLTANVGNTTVYAVPSSGAGWYRISCYGVVTTAATTSSTLPNCSIIWTDADSGVLAVAANGSSNFAVGQTNTGNVAGRVNETNAIQSSMAHVAASSNIAYNTIGYVSAGATPMAYALHVMVEYLGP